MPVKILLPVTLLFLFSSFTGRDPGIPLFSDGFNPVDFCNVADTIVREPVGVRGKEGSYTRTADGIIVQPDTNLVGNTGPVRLQVVAENIIRVTVSPTGSPVVAGGENGVLSLIRVGGADSGVKWEVRHDETTVSVSTGLVTATVRTATGVVRFTDRDGRVILGEKLHNGRSLEPAVFEGKPSYHLRQTFQLQPGEAIYGLGQHQDGIYNYNGRQVSMFQNNTEVAVPFFTSDRKYGILWDNCSLTTAGDIRPFQPLSALELFSARGEQGWLTASFANDRDHPEKIVAEKPASSINYSYLGDSKLYLPEEFKPASGVANWAGQMASSINGVHQFRFTYGGYLKVWIDGKLLLDRWRQSWSPGSAVLDVDMEKDRHYSVRIQWMPDGAESYISVKWQDPAPRSMRDDFSFASEAGRQLDYYFIYGKDMDEVIGGYRRLTGRAPIVPRWAMGFWQSRERYKTAEEILSTVREFRKRQIPLDNIVLDWSYWPQDAWGSQDFDAGRFPDPGGMINTLHKDYHTHFMISVWPKFYEGIPEYRRFDANNWLYRRNVADSQRDWIGHGYVSTFYDAFNADARKGFWDLLNRKLYSKGVDAFWMDASEPDILSNVSPARRKEEMTPTAMGPAAEVLNAYPLENARGIYEGQRATDTSSRVFILTRSAFAGSQRYGAAVWSGDIAARWSDMRTQISAGLNFCMSGIPYWTMDIGGFAVERRYEQARGADLDEWREQMTRWYQFGMFCPLFRVHGQFPYREIFNIAPEDHPAYKSMLYYDRLRYRLMPYLYSLAGMTWHQDYTIMRGLAMDFAGDTAVRNIGDEFMLGPSLLVAPVTEYKARSREVYLPAGQGWYDLYSGKRQEGGQAVRAEAPYERLPVYVREGSILPTGPALQYTDERPADTITLRVYGGKDARFVLYEDEGGNYNYEHGKFANIPVSYAEAGSMLTIGKREGQFSRMLGKRVFRVLLVKAGRPAELDFGKAAPVVVRYTGEAVSVKLK